MCTQCTHIDTVDMNTYTLKLYNDDHTPMTFNSLSFVLHNLKIETLEPKTILRLLIKLSNAIKNETCITKEEKKNVQIHLQTPHKMILFLFSH